MLQGISSPAVMAANPAPMVQQLPPDVQHRLAYVTGPEARSQTATPVESTVFRRLPAVPG
jgi:hypothetical protein